MVLNTLDGYYIYIGTHNDRHIVYKLKNITPSSEWKQISRQDDFKQTVQNMGVSTMCTPSPPSSSFLIYIYSNIE